MTFETDHPPEEVAQDIDSILSSGPDLANAQGPFTEAGEDNPEIRWRFYSRWISDSVGAFIGIVLPFGLITTGILAVALQIDGAWILATACVTGTVTIALAVLLGKAFKPNIISSFFSRF